MPLSSNVRARGLFIPGRYNLSAIEQAPISQRQINRMSPVPQIQASENNGSLVEASQGRPGWSFSPWNHVPSQESHWVQLWHAVADGEGPPRTENLKYRFPQVTSIPESDRLPHHYAHLLAQLEAFLSSSPDYLSSFTAAPCIIPNFFEYLSHFLDSPQHACTQRTLQRFLDLITAELYSKATNTEVQWGGSLSAPAKLVAMILAFRVEMGWTIWGYESGLMAWLAAVLEMRMSFKGKRPKGRSYKIVQDEERKGL